MLQAKEETESLGFEQWLTEVDYVISSEIRDCYPRAWAEDSITHKWLLAVTKRFREVTIADLDAPFSVRWDAYKATGAVENHYGDVGVIVRFGFSVDGRSASSTGVGFMEAKRLNRKKFTYEHIRWDQLVRQAANISSHRVLLYDFENMEAAELNIQSHGFCRHIAEAPYRQTHAATLLTHHVIASRTRSRNLSAIGIPLGYQLCTRYLRGLDLDYSVSPDKFLASIPGGVSYLMVAHVRPTEDRAIASAAMAPLPIGYHELEKVPWNYASTEEDDDDAEVDIDYEDAVDIEEMEQPKDESISELEDDLEQLEQPFNEKEDEIEMT
jgi:hypothetical protein